MNQFWDNRYNEDEFAYGTQPNNFLKANIQHIPAGNVLCLAAGEGRNAVYLAQKKYNITAVDQSSVGLNKALKLAGQQGVSIKTIETDLATFPIGNSRWHGVVSIFAHLPPAIRKKVHLQVIEGLKPGGVFLLEAYVERQLEMSGTGGPPFAQKEMFMSLQSLREELAGLEFLQGREVIREVNEGKYHRGPSAVVQVVAQKPLL